MAKQANRSERKWHVLMLLAALVGTTPLACSPAEAKPPAPVSPSAPAPVQVSAPVVPAVVATSVAPTLPAKAEKRQLASRATASPSPKRRQGTGAAHQNVQLVAAESAGALMPTLEHALAKTQQKLGALAPRIFVTVRAQQGGDSDAAFVRCTASVSQLPGKKLVASLSTRADVAGENTSFDDLITDASHACATSLADDLEQWLLAH